MHVVTAVVIIFLELEVCKLLVQSKKLSKLEGFMELCVIMVVRQKKVEQEKDSWSELEYSMM